ncbi:hypothetical protein [Bifidobacterium sp. SO4]|uniref:hypothetical protein n=1 Tax=Bifidobacterium sp. SO4 TaxID=2809030 RepID=UPI001BDBB9B1|nr:hypothetical protein [Bifidobacterium sp. SO4]MBT1171226.1 hypothetical protein [Bifidobacterium sp. SO4]
MTTKYSKEAFEQGKYHQLYSLLNNYFSGVLDRYPALTGAYGGDADAWAMKFIFTNTREPIDSLEYDKNCRNPKLIKFMQSCETNEEFEELVIGEAKHWLADLFDRTEFGKTRRVLEKDMEESTDIRFVKEPTNNCWHLLECTSAGTALSEDELRPTAFRHRNRIKWPADVEYDKVRRRERKNRPPLPRRQIVDCLHDILLKAKGSVEINVLTRLIIGLHPYMVRDGSDAIPSVTYELNFENMAYNDGNYAENDFIYR